MKSILLVLLAFIVNALKVGTDQKWGTHKPNLYFALTQRPSLKEYQDQNFSPLTFGLAWAVIDWRTGLPLVRHSVPFASTHENVEAHFVEADGQSYATEVITDSEYNARFEVTWHKLQHESETGWRVELKTNAIDKDRAVRVQPFFYLTKDVNSGKFQFNSSVESCDSGKVKSMKVIKQIDDHDSTKLVEESEYHVFEVQGVRSGSDACTAEGLDLSVTTMNLDMYPNHELQGVKPNPKAKKIEKVQVWQIEQVLKKYIANFLNYTAPEQKEQDPNVIIVKLGKTPLPDSDEKNKFFVQDQDRFIATFTTKKFTRKGEASRFTQVNEQIENTLKLMVSSKENNTQDFNARMIQVFNMKETDLESFSLNSTETEEIFQMQKQALANLIGNIGSGYGKLLREMPGRRRNKISRRDSFAQELFASYPSRSRFARGFIWDEGFHLLLICRWDEALCIEIIQSWFSTIDLEGWMPKEQVRGPEQEQNLSQDAFDLKIQNNLSPPSLVLPLQYLLEKAAEKKTSDNLKAFVTDVYPRLFTWHKFYLAFQKSQSLHCTFSYKHRTSNENEQSALDDYPRGNIVNNGYEIHLDLQTWMIELTQTVLAYAKFNENNGVYEQLEELTTCMKDKMETFLFNGKLGYHADYLAQQWTPVQSKNNDKFVEPIEWREDKRCGKKNLNTIGTPALCNQPYTGVKEADHARCCSEGFCQSLNQTDGCSGPEMSLHKSIDVEIDKQMVNTHSVHVGMVTLFPFIFGQLEDTERIETILSILEDEDQLSSKFGIRSLSAQDQFSGQSPNSYRGNIFVHFNYLILRALHKYGTKSTLPRLLIYRMKVLYSHLKQKIIQTVLDSWKSESVFWEQYDQTNGQGVGTSPFNGWTSLIVLIINDIY